MKVIDLTPEHEKLYFLCLEDWSSEMQEAGNHKECWYNHMKDKGLRVKLVLDEMDTVAGMIQYVPIEYSFVEGKELYFINCIWVHGYKQGVGNFQKQGMGKVLIQAAEADAAELGAKGMVAWGIMLPFFMRASWFRKQGYKKVDRQGMIALLWKPFTDDAVPPHWIKRKKTPQLIPDKVTVTAFINGWCPAQSITSERARRAATEFGDQVEFREINTLDRNTFLEWGISEALFIDDKELSTGPPPSFEKIKNRITKRVKKLKKSP